MQPEKLSWIRRYREGIFTTLGLMFSLAVATVTGWSSWEHIVHVGRLAGEPNAAVLPVAIDGLMMTGTVMAAVDRFRGMTTRGWAVAALWIGSLLTLAFNMASAWSRGLFAMGIAVLYAVALLVTVETMFHPSRTPLTALKRRKDRNSETSTPVPAPVAEVVAIADTKPEPDTSGRPGRKPGVPQTPPTKRRKKPYTTQSNGVQQRPTKPVQAVVIKAESRDEPPATPLAMEETVADLVATSLESREKSMEEVS